MIEEYQRLFNLISKKVINWDEVELIIESLGNHINDKYSDYSCDDGTILSELYIDSHSYERGEILVKLTRLFLKYGYDVHANNDFNGAICLHNLCWASYDKYVLHAAELLLNAGANTHINVKEDFEDGILNSISWKLVYWNLGYYETSNMFEAYYQMIQAQQAGDDYRGIRDASDCLGMTVTKVECLNRSEIENNRITFDDAIVFWFGSMPLVIDKVAELIVNPCRVCKKGSRTDISDAFSSFIGCKFVKYKYLNARSAVLYFDNDMKIVLSNHRKNNGDVEFGYLDIKSKYARN